MRTLIEACMSDQGPWVPAQLTDERSYYGHPVAIVEGETLPRSPIEVFMIRAVRGTDDVLLEEARQAGYVVHPTEHAVH